MGPCGHLGLLFVVCCVLIRVEGVRVGGLSVCCGRFTSLSILVDPSFVCLFVFCLLGGGFLAGRGWLLVNEHVIIVGAVLIYT